MRDLLFFSKKELAVVLAVGIITGLVDDRVEMLQFTLAARTHLVVLVNDYLAYVTGGPIFGDLLEAWLEFGAVLAACLVRKPGAGTIALTINGFCQVFVNGTHDPHLLYGVPGLGADVVFAFFRYRRYDWIAVSLAGVGCAMFWYPIVWFTHGIYLYPLSFILPDIGFRVLGSAVGDGLLGGAIALVVLRLAGKRWEAWSVPAGVGGGRGGAASLWRETGFLIASIGVLIIVLTHSIPAVSSFFLSAGPKIPGGIASEEEYNPGYMVGVVMIFLVATMLAFRSLESRRPSPDRA